MINTIYQTVQALANKDQRGYISPQEFNLFAEHAQMDIFDQYFYDVNQFKRLGRTDVTHQDSVSNLEYKIDKFMSQSYLNPLASLNQSYGGESGYRMGQAVLPETIYRIVDVQSVSGYDVERMSVEKFRMAMRSYLTRPKSSRPAYCFKGGRIDIYPSTACTLNYIRKPFRPKWTFTKVEGAPLYNPDANDHQDFEIHASDESELVYRILALAGIAMKQPNLLQSAVQLEGLKVQQEKI